MEGNSGIKEQPISGEYNDEARTETEERDAFLRNIFLLIFFSPSLHRSFFSSLYSNMVKLLQRLFGSFVSAITFCFISYQDHHHTKSTKIMPKSRPLSLQTVELKVRMCCTGCERVVKDAIHKLRGVDSIEVDLEMEKVTVIGYVDRNKVLKAVRRAGKRAEFWPFPNPPLYFTSAHHYFKDTTTDFKESYNYWRHGYNAADRHGALHVTHRGDDRVSNLFNDDNVNACHVM